MPRHPKLGLALSGGGFRASLFHIGVLARLAELGVLKSVDVISTVSGGSIVGAHYYLLLKKLLESKTDAEIKPSDYSDLVREVERTFLAGVQRNLRTRAYAGIVDNFKMIWSKRFTRSDRMAKLYDEYFYASAAGKRDICMNELKIAPRGWMAPAFNPRLHNKARKHKIPALIINATTLNTGRNWQFSAVEAGEYEQDGGETYNKNTLCVPFRYEIDGKPNPVLPKKYQEIPLSIAVAASACVPGIFVPLPLTDLYCNFVPKLVDGGVYDNQGIFSLIHARCTHIFVSDASGQMDDQIQPGSGILSVLMRSNSVLTDRTRDAGFEHLSALKECGELDFAALHLRQEFVPPELHPHEGPKPWETTVPPKTKYEVRGEVQYRLSNIRTDLDSFTTIEAQSLMCSGHSMTGAYFPARWRSLFRASPPDPKKISWGFHSMAPYVRGERRSERFKENLKAGEALVFKAFRLVPGLGFVGIALALLLLVLLACAAVQIGFENSIRLLGFTAFVLLVHGILSALPKEIRFLYRIDEFAMRVTAGATAMIFGWLLSRIHLLLVERLYLKYGSSPTHPPAPPSLEREGG